MIKKNLRYLVILIFASGLSLFAQSKPAAIGHPSILSPHAKPIAFNNGSVFVANTSADTLDIISAKTGKITARVNVGIDPVSVAVRPDGKEVWVSNHISDSVSVVDTDPASSWYLQVVATIQDIDVNTKTTNFDEPVGLAFADNNKAYVALSSQNQIAVIDVKTRKISKKLRINAQDPRAIFVRNNKLYVIPFESNNKTQLSGGNGPGSIDGKLVTYDAAKSVAVNNVLSKGHVEDIIKHPQFPDRDLYIFDTKTDRLIKTVDSLGTLLYGLTADSKGNIFIAQTDARNDANGKAGTKKHSLKEMENRAFLNQISKVSADGSKRFMDLEPLPPKHPKPGVALATPFGIQISSDDKTLFVTAAGSDVFFTIDAQSGHVLGRLRVGAVPRGIAIETVNGVDQRAWVLNAVGNTVHSVDIVNRESLKPLKTIELEDPTPAVLKRGRIAFNTARASTTGTFSCASCHPDGHTDQLLWVLKTPVVTGGTQIQPRATMPVRGLRDTAPYHWDGIPGDPYGGNNSANLHGSDKPNSDINKPESATRFVIDGGLASTMMMPGHKGRNNEGKLGNLTSKERDDMAVFLLDIPYAPAQKRSYTNELSQTARQGFELFHVKGNLEGKPQPNVCGDCHRMPFLTSTNTPGDNGMDAPTWRGAIDRFLLTPQGRSNVIGLPHFIHFANAGFPEKPGWKGSWKGQKRFDPVMGMIEEGSTGFSGAFGRQLTLSKSTADEPLTKDLLSALEKQAGEGAVVLQVEGQFIVKDKKIPMILQYDARFKGGSYVRTAGKRYVFSRAKLVSMASAGEFTGTFTGRHGAGLSIPQPAVWTLGSLHEQRGNQLFPRINRGNSKLTMSGRHIHKGAYIVINGKRVPAKLNLGENEKVEITLSKLPTAGLNFLQIQNPGGLFSNDFIFYVESFKEAVARSKKEPQGLRDSNLWSAITNNSLEEAKIAIEAGASLKSKNPAQMIPLAFAAFYGRTEIVNYLISKGADIHATNTDGCTALHWAGAFGYIEICKALLKKGADPNRKNKAGHTPVQMAWGWPDSTRKMFESFSQSSFYTSLNVDFKRLKKDRPKALKLLQ